MIRSRVGLATWRKSWLLWAAVSVFVLTVGSLQAAVPGTATVSGTVTASQPFTAAQVYMRNLDKGIVYMVYAQAGRFRAVALFPGNYEISASTKQQHEKIQSKQESGSPGFRRPGFCHLPRDRPAARL